MTTPRRKQTRSLESFKPPYKRKRVFGGMTPGVFTYTIDSSSIGQGITSGELPHGKLVRGSTVLIDDTVTPGYKMLVAQGHIINNGWTKIVLERGNKSSTIRYTHKYNGTWGEHYGDSISWYLLPGPLALTDSDVDESKVGTCVYNATVQARSNVRPAEALSLVTLAEFPKTIQLVAEQVARLATAVQMMKKGRPAKAIMAVLGKNTSRGVATIPKGKRLAAAKDIFLQRWLETRYGWAPLMYDVQGHIAALDALREVKHPRYTARGRFTKTWETESTELGSTVVQTQPWTFQKKVDWTATARAYVLYTVDSTFEPANAFGISSMPLSLWELVPLSFVVDWFLSVGDWLGAITPKVGVTTLAEGATVAVEGYAVRRITAITAHADWDVDGVIGHSDEAAIELRRRTTGLPSLFYPPVRIKLNPTRLMDALGLLVGAAGRSTRI